MPITNYSVLKGQPTAGEVVDGASAHYQITVRAGSQSLTVAVNIESVDGSEVLYAIVPGFQPPDAAALAALPSGFTALPSQPGGLALDYVREQVSVQGRVGGQPMITRAQMSLLPKPVSHARFLEEEESRRAGTVPVRASAHALANAVVTLLNQAVATPGAEVFAFGSAYADGGVTAGRTSEGIHDIHMNQGNPGGNHGDDNGTWQDGALWLSLPGAAGSPATFTAIFIAFQTESWTTDGNGDPTTP